MVLPFLSGVLVATWENIVKWGFHKAFLQEQVSFKDNEEFKPSFECKFKY